MRKRIITTLVTAVATLAIVALPAGAGNSTPTGVRLNLLGGTTRAILANTPFYVRHGFMIVDGDSTPAEIQQSSVTLSMDGVSARGVVDQQFSDTKPRTLVGKFNLFNFPSGLTEGTHTAVITFRFRGQDILVRTLTIYSLASCEFGVAADGLQCSGPPSP